MQYKIGIRNSDVNTIQTNSFVYRQSSLQVQTLNGHDLLILLCFVWISLKRYFADTYYQIMAVCIQFVLRFVTMVARHVTNIFAYLSQGLSVMTSLLWIPILYYHTVH